MFLPYAGSLPCARRPPITQGWRRLTGDGGNSLAALGAARRSRTNHTGKPGARHTSHAPRPPKELNPAWGLRSSGGKPLPTRPPRGRSPLGRSLPSRVTARTSPPTGRGGLHAPAGTAGARWIDCHQSGRSLRVALAQRWWRWESRASLSFALCARRVRAMPCAASGLMRRHARGLERVCEGRACARRSQRANLSLQLATAQHGQAQHLQPLTFMQACVRWAARDQRVPFRVRAREAAAGVRRSGLAKERVLGEVEKAPPPMERKGNFLGLALVSERSGSATTPTPVVPPPWHE